MKLCHRSRKRQVIFGLAMYSPNEYEMNQNPIEILTVNVISIVNGFSLETAK